MAASDPFIMSARIRASSRPGGRWNRGEALRGPGHEAAAEAHGPDEGQGHEIHGLIGSLSSSIPASVAFPFRHQATSTSSTVGRRLAVDRERDHQAAATAAGDEAQQEHEGDEATVRRGARPVRRRPRRPRRRGWR